MLTTYSLQRTAFSIQPTQQTQPAQPAQRTHRGQSIVCIGTHSPAEHPISLDNVY